MFDYSKYSQYLLKTLKERELQELILKIKSNFTINREEINQYVLTEREVSAYAAFYGYSNYFKLADIFKRLPEQLIKELGETELIDMGSGSGSFSLAWAHHFENTKKIIMIEQSKLMQTQAEAFMQAFAPEVQTSKSWSNSDRQTLLFGHSFNEIGIETSQEMIKKMNPEFIFLIEPGTKAVFSEMLELRSVLIQKGYTVKYPCQNDNDCPLVGQDKDWCHQYLDIRYDAKFESLCQKIKMDRRRLPMTIHLYQKAKASELEAFNTARVIRALGENKFCFEFDLCKDNQRFRFEVMKKHYKKNEQKLIAKILSGDLITFEIDKELSLSLKRGKISLNS